VRSETSEAEHRPCDAFDGAVVLIDEVVQVLRLAHLAGDLLGHAVQVHGAFEECPDCGVISLGAQQEVVDLRAAAPQLSSAPAEAVAFIVGAGSAREIQEN
jgi:hypothetical protein